MFHPSSPLSAEVQQISSFVASGMHLAGKPEQRGNSVYLRGQGRSVGDLVVLPFLKVLHSKDSQSCIWSSLLPHVESVLGSLQPEEQ